MEGGPEQLEIQIATLLTALKDQLNKQKRKEKSKDPQQDAVNEIIKAESSIERITIKNLSLEERNKQLISVLKELSKSENEMIQKSINTFLDGILDLEDRVTELLETVMSKLQMRDGKYAASDAQSQVDAAQIKVFEIIVNDEMDINDRSRELIKILETLVGSNDEIIKESIEIFLARIEPITKMLEEKKNIVTTSESTTLNHNKEAQQQVQLGVSSNVSATATNLSHGNSSILLSTNEVTPVINLAQYDIEIIELLDSLINQLKERDSENVSNAQKASVLALQEVFALDKIPMSNDQRNVKLLTILNELVKYEDEIIQSNINQFLENKRAKNVDPSVRLPKKIPAQPKKTNKKRLKKPKFLKKALAKVKKNKRNVSHVMPITQQVTAQQQATVPQAQKKPAKIEKRFGSYLLAVEKDDFELASDYFRAHPDKIKIKKGTVVKDRNGQDFTFTYSMIAMKNAQGMLDVYAMADREYLGEGAYGRVKITQNKNGQTFAVKIEGKGKSANDVAEESISKHIGYLKGTVSRKLDDKKVVKGREVEEKTYSIYQLRKGKEIFEQLYTNVLTPGQLYTKDEQEQLRKDGNDALTETQKLLVAYKSCQVVQDLHNRGVIHGDLKPANLMADIEGHQIVVGSIDLGFSTRLDRTTIPPQIFIDRDSAPEGTHPRYMPPEVRVAAKKADEFNPDQLARFSAASDVYSLGVMFADDLQLPDQIVDDMKSNEPGDRASLYQVMDNLVNQLEALPEAEQSPEIKKIIQEHKTGVKRINQASGPQEQKTFIGQLMSGFRDPRESVGDATYPSYYTLDDYQEMAIGLYDVIKPETLYEDMINAFKELDDSQREIFAHNAGLFINEILKADVGNEFEKKNTAGIANLTQIFNEKQKAAFQSNISENVNKMKLAVESQSGGVDNKIDLKNYIEQVLLSNSVDSAEMNKNVDLFTTDLKEMQIRLFVEIKPFDLLGKKIDNDKFHELPYTKISDIFNQVSTKVIHDIALARSKEHQLAIYQFYVYAMEKSLEKGDYNTAQAINSAFNSAAFGKLNYLKQDAQLNAIVNKCSVILNPQKSYKELRDDIQKKQQSKVVVVPLLSSLNGDLTFAKENSPISEVTKKANGNKVQLLGRFICDKISNMQSSMEDRPPVALQTNVSEILEAPVAENYYYQDRIKKYMSGDSGQPDFTKVTNDFEENMAAQSEKYIQEIDVIKSKIKSALDGIQTELTNAPPNVSALVDLRGQLLDLANEAKKYNETNKYNSNVVNKAREIDIDEKVIGANNSTIREYLLVNIQKYNEKQLNDNEVKELYNLVKVSHIFSDFYFANTVLDFKKAIENKNKIAFLQGVGTEPSAAKKLASLLVQFKDTVSLNQNTSNNHSSEINELISRMKELVSPGNEPLNSIAVKVNAEIQPMVEKYNAVQAHLKNQSDASQKKKSSKSIKGLAKSTVKRVKRLKNNKNERPKDLSTLINELDEAVQLHLMSAANISSNIVGAASSQNPVASVTAAQVSADVVYDPAEDIAFLNGDERDEASLSAYRNLELNLKLYAIMVMQSESNDVKDDAQLKSIANLERDINFIIDKVNEAKTSPSNTVRNIAAKVSAKINPMVEKYHDLKNHLAEPIKITEPQKKKKSVRNVAKNLPKRVKELRYGKPKPADAEKDLISLINALRDETLRRTRDESERNDFRAKVLANEMAKKDIDKPSPSTTIPVGPEDGIGPEFDDDQIVKPPVSDVTSETYESRSRSRPRSFSAPSSLSVVPESTDAALPSVPAPDSRYSKPFAELKKFQEILSDPDNENRNQIRIDAMKAGMALLNELDPKPRNFSEVVKCATTDNVTTSQLIATKEAAKTVLSVIIPPNAKADQLAASIARIQDSIEHLEGIADRTSQIEKRIALRKDVVVYLNQLLVQKAHEMKVVANEGRPLAITPQGMQSRARAQSAPETRSASNNELTSRKEQTKKVKKD